MAAEGPRQVWIWSRVDGSLMQHRVRPGKLKGCWIEERPTGWEQYPEYFLCDSPDEAIRQARAHFQRIARNAQAVLARLAPPAPSAEDREAGS